MEPVPAVSRRLSLALVACALVALMGVSLGLPGTSTDSASALLELLLMTILGSAAAVHRGQSGGALGVGAAILPVVGARFGTAAAGWSGGLALILAELVRRAFYRHFAQAQPERRQRLRGLAAAARCSLAVLASGGVAMLAARSGGSRSGLVAGGLTYLVVLAVLEPVERGRLIGGRSPRPLLLEAGGWGLGAVLTLASPGLLVTASALAAVAGLSVEAARHASRSEGLAQRIDDLENLGTAGQRIGGRGGELAKLAEQIRDEVRNVLAFSWFHLELLDGPASPGQSWRSGPAGALEEGSPKPGKSPPPLPGIHRRSAWELLDRELQIEGRSVARLRLWCDPRRLDRQSLELLDLLLPQMAASVERSILDREARHDSLTGVPVRRVFDAELEESYRESCEDGLPLSVVLCDLDHFKSINDTYGHGVGDAALSHVAGLLSEHGRDGDLCCRYGGEEFALLLRQTRGRDALRIAERLRRAVNASPCEVEGQRLTISLSAGVASFPETYARSAGELVVLADTALYAAKEEGRNRCLLNLGHGRYLAGDSIGGAESLA